MTTTTTWRLVPSEPDQDWTDAFAVRGPRIGSFDATIRAVLDTAPAPGFALVTELQAIRATLAFLPTSDAAVSGLDRVIGNLDAAPNHMPATKACAPVEQQDEALRPGVRDALAAALGSAYDCTRVWSAWGVGTMGPDDFRLIADDADRVSDLADAAIAAMRSAATNVQGHTQDERTFEDELERAYWEMDARIKGLGKHKGRPQPDRDAFKWAIRGMACRPTSVPTLATSIFGEKIGRALDGSGPTADEAQSAVAREVQAELRPPAADAEKCPECERDTAGLNGEPKWCCYCGGRLTGVPATATVADNRLRGLASEALAWIENSAEPALSLCADLRAALANAFVMPQAVACLRRQRDGSDWGRWTPGTMEDGKRVMGLRTWQVCWIVDPAPQASAAITHYECGRSNGDATYEAVPVRAAPQVIGQPVPDELATLQKRAASWNLVCRTLDEVSPGWSNSRACGKDCASAAIRKLAVQRHAGDTLLSVRLLAAEHDGMRVDYTGLLGQARSALKRGEAGPALAELLHQLAVHLTELGQRWYAGDVAVVDELLQLYSIESDARAALVAHEGGGNG